MSQEFVLPLALAWALPIPGNPYYQAPAIRDWVAAGIRFAAGSAHRDGSCDDYYPFERASGAAAFSLYACLEAIRLTELDCDRADHRLPATAAPAGSPAIAKAAGCRTMRR